MRLIFFCILSLILLSKSIAQIPDTSGAFKMLEKYAYGIPLRKHFDAWENKIKNDDNYTYRNEDFKKYGVIFSNIISLKTYNTFDNTVDSVLFILKNIEFKSVNSTKVDTANYIQIYIVFKRKTLKESVDSIFKSMESSMKSFFNESNINRNKFNNGVKTLYSITPENIIYPITLQKYFDEDLKKYIITIFINKRKEYTNPLTIVPKMELLY